MRRLAHRDTQRRQWPNIDGKVLPTAFYAAYAAGEHHDVPIIVGASQLLDAGTESLSLSRWFCLTAWTGCNSNEGSGTYTTRHWGRVRGFTHPHPLPDHPAAGPDPECYGGRRLELAALYPGLTHDDPRAIQDLSGDQSFGHKARWFAIHSRTPAWLYSFQRQPPGKRHTTGAPHGGEVAFVHGFDEDSRQCMSLAGPHCPEDFALADTMHEFWTVFAAVRPEFPWAAPAAQGSGDRNDIPACPP